MLNHLMLIFCIYCISNPKYLVTTCTFVGFESAIPYEYLVSLSSTVICQTAGQQKQEM